MTAIPEEAALGFERVVVDLAAGTGKLTRALLGLGAQVVAIDPVAGMREQLQRAVPGVEVLDGTAGRMPLDEGSADTLRARIASLSFVALLDDEPRGRLLDEVSALVAARDLVAADGLLDTPYRTHITWCRRIEM